VILTVNTMKAPLYGLRFIVRHHRLGKTMPLIRGLVLTNRCNLGCQHCRLTERGQKDLDFEEVTAAIDQTLELKPSAIFSALKYF
jgi:MoaA/NifB/PqqE/SkfB family radical SAM enzyme